MRTRLVMVMVTLALVGCSASAAAPPAPVATASSAAALPGLTPPLGIPSGLHPIQTCVLPSGIRCHSLIMAGPQPAAGPAGFTSPIGFAPADLASAYGLTPYLASGGAGQTVGIVTVFDDPNLETDLNHYRTAFGLPACTTASGCLKKVDELGQPETAIPAAAGSAPDLNFGALASVIEELSLDVDMVSAACPKCHILVVEAYALDQVPVTSITDVIAGVTFMDLARAANTASRLGAQVVSTSYGGLDGATMLQPVEDLLYKTPGTIQLASTGDSGYGTEYPAASPNVIAVGGTTLSRNGLTPRHWDETAWSGAGSGCSLSEPKPAWQRDPLCPNRAVADISAVADPATGVAVYDTYGSKNGAGWFIIGGTSASSPLVAGIIALAGNATSMGIGAQYLYAHPTAFHDIQGGATKKGCGDYTCRGDVAFDGPTGLGTPNGIGGL